MNALNFQQLRRAEECLRNWFNIEIFDRQSPSDVEFLVIMMQRRHLFTHNGGRVDEKYISETGDKTVRLNQVIKVRSTEIVRLIPLLHACAKNLYDGFESIT